MEESKTILVVDDEESVRMLLSQSLRRCGFSLLEAASGPDAIQMTRQYSDAIHVLVSDVMMPGMTGIELARELSAERPSLKVVLISGFSVLPPSLDKGWEFLQKPFPPSALAEKVQRLCAPCDGDGRTQAESASRGESEEALRLQMRDAREEYVRSSQEYERLLSGTNHSPALEDAATARKNSLQAYADCVRQFAEFMKRKPGAFE
jgi:CheY-like chemotaxis protein